MFEITGADIAKLGDEDLRALIGLLCEAEMRRRRLPVSAVTWGGDQNATDGGLDIRVELPLETSIGGFIPKPQAGFQVKKEDMPASEILKEMKPGGKLRASILGLADVSGSYIIASSNGSTSDAALRNRRKAMAEAIADTEAAGRLTLDFYDRGRIATWVRDHPGLVLWVRTRAGKAIPGWQPFGSWSRAPAGVDNSFIVDDHARVRTSGKGDGEELSTIEGINRIRNLLRQPGHVVRLVGLSGVGKTRFAEALFDASLGEGALDASLAIYANVADEPNPPPAGLASDLTAEGTRAVLVIDNCPPSLHRQLSEIVRSSGATISVITIEYDIREDQPEGTDVFSLENSSPEVIEKLVERRYPDLSEVDARTIANVSGGNARVALALASRIEQSETVSALSEDDLFKRLFHQRHDLDKSLLSVAQASSLVYSFNGTDTGQEAELSLLGSLVDESPQAMYSGVAELIRRDLVQARGKWRAVLPHAIANRLAKLALQDISPARVSTVFLETASERLLGSFSRRLGYLGDSNEAQTLVREWLAPGGLLGDVASLGELGAAMLANVAPVTPDAALSALEKAFLSADRETLKRNSRYLSLLRSLAYEPTFFRRALTVLVRFASIETADSVDRGATAIVASLFHLVLSGTHAPCTMRVEAAEALLRSSNPRERELGMVALEALLKAEHFSSTYDFDFGVRSRDFGYLPKTAIDFKTWFDQVLKLARATAVSDGFADEVGEALAKEFRDLWFRSHSNDELDRLFREIGAKAFWRPGWIAVRQTLLFDKGGMPEDRREQLAKLEEFLRPKDLVSKVRAAVTGRSRGFGLDDLDEEEPADDEEEVAENYKRRADRDKETILRLGEEVAADGDVLRMLLPELMRGDSRVAQFGAALGTFAQQPAELWGEIVEQFRSANAGGLHLLGGYVRGLEQRDPDLANRILDHAIDDPVLGPWFPALQAFAKIDAPALARLHRSLDLGRAPIRLFHSLGNGRALDGISAADLRNLVRAIVTKSGGSSVGVDLVSMRLLSDQVAKREPENETRDAGRLALEAFVLPLHSDRSVAWEDHELGRVARASLANAQGIAVVRAICRTLVEAAARYDISAHDFDDLLKALLQLHPEEVLSELFNGDARSQRRGVDLVRHLGLHKKLPDVLPDEVLLSWCDKDPKARYPLATSIATLFKRPRDDEQHAWTPITAKLLQGAPEPEHVLAEILARLRPTSWSGSLATKLEGRMKLLKTLPGGDSGALVERMRVAQADLQARIDAEHKQEKLEASEVNSRFE